MDKYKNILAEIIKGKTQWPDLKTELSKYNIHKEDTSAGKIFEVFTKYYFLTAPEHIGQYENVWLYDDIPLKVKEKLDLGKSRIRDRFATQILFRRIYRSSV